MNLSDYISDPALLTESVTHRSYCNEHPGTVHNERLEFLGDSVLSLIISDRLFRLLPGVPEGELTARRSSLVQTTSLADKSRELKLNELLQLSHGEEESGGRNNTSLLANTFEAVLGAIFISSGLDMAYRFLNEVFPDQQIISDEIKIKDAKSLLQEMVQSKGWGTPVYRIVETSGPDHAKKFVISVEVNSQSQGTGEGPSKQKAETQAAAVALKQLFPESLI